MRKCISPNALCTLLVLCISLMASAQGRKPHLATGERQINVKKTGLDFIENKGQWVPEARFKAELPGGVVFITDHGFVYNYYNQQDIFKATGHDADGHEQDRKSVV